MIFCGVLLTVFFTAWMLTRGLRRYALNNSLIDIPNERSSHSIPTPRGGGVAIVISFSLVLPILVQLDMLGFAQLIALLGPGLLVAAIGFADDHGHIAARWRLLGHFIAAGWVLFWLGGLASVSMFGTTFQLGWVGHALALIYLVWMLNLYNFMDGIDGLASAEAICACLGMCAVYLVSGADDLVWAPLVLAAAVAGFLWWNFPPARIFMGDAGSGFLGVMLGGLTLLSTRTSFELFWCWVILLGVFIIDATFTLLRRMSQGHKVYQAHCNHAYQNASRHYQSHKSVTLAVVLINLIWLLPIAMLVAAGAVDGAVGGGIAYVPLVALAWKFRAGLNATSSLPREEK